MLEDNFNLAWSFWLMRAKFLPIKHSETYENCIGLNGRNKMGVQNLPEDILLVDLPLKEPQIANELKSVNETMSNNGNCNVIIDFSGVEIITSSSISNLIILLKLLQERGRQLILCNVAVVTKCIFTVAGLDKVFDFADDRSAALAAMHVPISSQT